MLLNYLILHSTVLSCVFILLIVIFKQQPLKVSLIQSWQFIALLYKILKTSMRSFNTKSDMLVVIRLELEHCKELLQKFLINHDCVEFRADQYQLIMKKLLQLRNYYILFIENSCTLLAYQITLNNLNLLIELLNITKGNDGSYLIYLQLLDHINLYLSKQ